jgi:putative acyl-CoA dehydrogenase
MQAPALFETHTVDNQPPEFAPRDLWQSDATLREAVAREGAAAFVQELADYGKMTGEQIYQLSFDAHRDKPRLRTHDRFGSRINRVEFHPAYHQIMRYAVEHGVAGLSWRDTRQGAQVARAALSFLHHQVEPGSSCPLTMTHAAVPVLRREPGLREWAEKACAPHYDQHDVPMTQKRGVTIGMGMTEKQGGSDVRANTTRATPINSNGEYTLIGHKWFFSAPMCDGFLVLAQAPGGLSCFLLPRWRADGTRNHFKLMRLKDKLGDWSNASSEVEFTGAWAQRIGEEGRGVATILQMVMLTRLDCMLGSAAEIRMAFAQAMHHCTHRRTFGKALVEHPLMRQVLMDLRIESDAATCFALRVARAVDESTHDNNAAAFARIATAIGKYWICKRAPTVVAEALECLGGAGYVEESMLPRLYRQAPLNSIWEGSGNIQCLDVLRALSREPATKIAILQELQTARGLHVAFDQALLSIQKMLSDAAPVESAARYLVERLALALQAAVLLRAQSPIAELFCRSRLAGEQGMCLGAIADVGEALVI